MEGLEHKLFFVSLFNTIFGKPVYLLFSLLGIKLNPHQPIPDHVVMIIFSAFFLLLFFGLASRKLSIYPSPIQTLLETIYGFFESIAVDFMGEEGKKYVPMITTLGLFILTCNLIGLIPGFMAPTSNLNVPVGCAIFAVLYYHFQGIKKHGVFGYLKNFAGPVWWLSWLIFPVEIISHLARPFSLSIRLFGNILGEELLILVLATLFPFIVPLPFMLFAVLTSFIQALVFVFLTTTYIAGAVAMEEH